MKAVSCVDRDILEPVLLNSGRWSCEFSYTNLIVWSPVYKTKWVVINSHIYICLDYDDMLTFAPGKSDGPTVEELLHVSDMRRAEGASGNYDVVSGDWIDKHRPECEKYFDIRPMDEAFYEYIYRVDSLVALRGKKLAKKKNLIHQFLRDYPDATQEPLTRDNLHECLQLEDEWNASFPDKDSIAVQHEHAVLANLPQLFDKVPMEGIVLRAGGRLVAFSTFSPIGPDIWTENFEKARHDVKGASQYITHLTACALQGRATWLNREQDLGLPGLRQAKLSYDPEIILQEYCLIRK